MDQVGDPAALAAPSPSVSEPVLRPGGALRLDEAIQLALSRNPGLSAIRRQVGVAEAEVEIARQYPYNPEFQTSSAGDSLGAGRDREADIAVGLGQTFETGGKRRLRSEAASLGLDAARAKAADAELRVREEVSTAFFAGLLAAARRKVAETQLDLGRRLLEVAEARRVAGDISELEVNLVRLEVHQAEAARVEGAAEVARSLAALRELLGLGRAEPLGLEGGFPLPKPMRGEDLAVQALARRQDLRALRLERERAAARAALERAMRRPDVTAGIFYQYTRGSIENPSGAPLNDRDQLLGFNVAIPIPILNRRRGEMLAATREVARLDAEVLAIEARIHREVAVAGERLHASRARAALYQDEISPLAEWNLEQTREAYRLGEIGTVEVLRAQDERARVAFAAAEALHDRAVAEVALDAAVGGAP
ncbi:MAG: TolC family protein [Planctomycetes bacterium]|nr:TolC family protein [Planctomycetota bacterium]